jgi:site-specific recombinase XerC
LLRYRLGGIFNLMRLLNYNIQEFGNGYRIYVGNGRYRKAATKLAAEKIVTELKLARTTRGRELAEVPAPLLAELLKQNERCLEAGTTLEAAVNHWLPIFKAKSKSLPLSDAVDEYLAEAKGRLKPPTLRDKKQRLKSWVNAQAEETATVVEACDAEMLRGFLDDERERTSDRNHRNIWLVISAFCSWCVKRHYLAENPCSRIETYTRGSHDEIAVFLPEQASALLKLAIDNYDREVLSYLVLSLFGGLRPHEFITQDKSGVWHHLDWQAVGKDIVKGARLGKTRRARRIPVGPTLANWIEFIRDKEGGQLTGPIVSNYSFYQRFRRWKRAYVPAKIVIEKDVLRHSYGTYRVVELGVVGKVAVEMGNSEATVRTHYLNGERSTVEANQFWAMTPDAVTAETKKEAS